MKQIARKVLVLALCFHFVAGGADAQHRTSEGASVFFDAPYSRAYEDTMVHRMEAGMDRFLDRHNERVRQRRGEHWDRDLSSPAAYSRSVEPARERLRTLIGAGDERVEVSMEHQFQVGDAPQVAETERYTIHQVRWPVLPGVSGEGLLITPSGSVQARVVAIPDADQSPEEIAGLAEPQDPTTTPFALHLAENGVQVVVPTLVNRQSTFSVGEDIVPSNPWREGRESVSLRTNIPHREWIYRQAYPMGRHIIGFEVQKVLAAVDWFVQQDRSTKVGVVGYGEGGLLAFYAAAVDERIDAALVSGYFGPREDLWREPIYRNVWGLLEQFGDAEIASLIAPRRLIVEYSEEPSVAGPPFVEDDNREAPDRIVRAAVPGRLQTPPLADVMREVERLEAFFSEGGVQAGVQLVHGENGSPMFPVSENALDAVLRALDLDAEVAALGKRPSDARSAFDPDRRQKRQVEEMMEYLRNVVHTADYERYRFVQGDYSSPSAWDASMDAYREYLYDEVTGRIAEERLPPNPRMRQVFDEEAWTGHEVVLDVWPDVFAWGILAVPKDLEAGERRPVVVVQHGHAGTPTTPIRVDSYNEVLPRLVERGFIVFAPFNPYQFNIRKATPLKTSVFSFIIPQHRQIVDWLQSLDFVDAGRIGFYGKSWGGRTALRVPALISEYALAVCSAYFNQWPRKATTVRYRNSYMFTSSVGVYEFNQGHTLAHAEMAGLVAPRPFLVESGYLDGVAAHEWVGYEFAKVQRLYDMMGIGERAELGFFIGRHEVDLDTTLSFLHRHLDWPAPE